MATILSIQHISKSYGPVQALKDVSFDVPEGSVYGILGPNGSGKTTLLGTVLNVLLPDSGVYHWFGGMEHGAARRQIGALLETPNFYHYLSAMDNLGITAAIRQRGLDDRLRVLEQVGLSERRDSKFQTYSLGMKQRLAIGATLLGTPKILVLDEPTNGLDPAGIAEIRDLIRQLSGQGMTIIIASHLLDEVEKICTHVAILKKGHLLLHGAVDEVLQSEDILEIGAEDMITLQAILSNFQGIRDIRRQGNLLQLLCGNEVSPAKINAYCAQHGVTLDHLVLRKKSLETKFMEITN